MDFLRRKQVERPPIEWPKPGQPAGDETDPAADPQLTPTESAVPPGSNSETEPVIELKKRIGAADMLARSWYKFSLYCGLILGILVFYLLADYTAYTTAEQRPGQLVISNTMTQLWTACFRMTFNVGFCLVLMRLFLPELFRYWRPDAPDDPDLINTIRYQLTPFQRSCVFFFVFFGFLFLFILMLMVNLPETISVGR